MHSILTRLGYRLLEADSAREAIELWSRHGQEIDLLLTDVLLPGRVGGVELSERFRSESPQLKVVYVTGYSTEVVAETPGLELGVNFLTKPFDTRELARIVRLNLDELRDT